MKSTQEESPTVLPSDSLVPLESVLCTEELNRRPTRLPDYETENRALVALAQALADSPLTILQTLADTILEVFQCDSAGISLLTTDDGGKRFHWPAIAGVWKPHIGGGTPRDFGPCGDVLDRNAPLLFRHFERRYTYFLPVTPPVEECLLVPFYVEGKAVGTIWAIAHDDRRKFDAEDMRQLVSLGRFASSAYQVAAFMDALDQQGDTLRQNHTELAQNMAELRKANVQAQDSRRAALNLMEDAVRSRQAMGTLNVELRESEERYRTLFAAAPMAVFVCDRHAVIQHWNRRAVELWGREPACGVEQHCGSVKLWLPDGTLLPHAQSPIVEVLRTDIPALNVEVFIERPDGSRLPVLVNFAALKNAQGEITGAITSFIDITERKRTEEILRQREAHLRQLNETLVSILATIPDIVFVTGADGEIEFKNAAAEHFARTVGVNDGLPSPIEIELKRVLATGERHLPTSFKMVHRFGIANTERYFLSRIVGMTTPEKRVFGAVVMLQDVTEFRLLDEVKTDLISTVSHELKTPITSLRTALMLLLEQTIGTLNEKQIQMVGIARDETERLLRTLNALLDLTRFEEKTLGLKVETATADALIRSSVKQTAIAAEAARVFVKVELEPDLPALNLDSEQIMHVLTNFLTNAIKYSPAHSSILVQARKHGDGIYFGVVDHGPGVPKEYQSRIFEKFFRVPGTTKKGAGLGLAIARECVRAHRGQIGVRSEDGQGSEFYFILPRGE